MIIRTKFGRLLQHMKLRIISILPLIRMTMFQEPVKVIT